MGEEARLYAKTGRGLVLVVDDDDAVRRVVTRVLSRAGQQTVAAAGGASALALLATTQVDAVITDISMPSMSGIDLLRAIRERDLDLPVVLVTGAPALETAIEALELGAFDYVQKPGFDRLTEITARAVALGRIGRAKRAAMEAAAGPSFGGRDLVGLEASFDRAMGSLWSAYQPILDRHGVLVGHESLMRTREPSLPHPGAVIDAAERLSRRDELCARMRELAAEHLVGRRDQLFVNLHPSDLGSDALLASDCPLRPIADRVILEITERAALPESKEVRERIDALRSQGYRIAVDDLGAGYAGLNSFALLEPEVVKLDMSLVRDVDKNLTKQKVIGGFTALCHDMGILVVAEGIETSAELEKTLQLGCDLFQGYALARPGPPFPVPAWPVGELTSPPIP